MRHVLAIGKRELISYFLSPVGYVVGALFTFIYMGIFWGFGFAELQDANAVLGTGIAAVMTCVVFAVPFLTMGLMADEKRSGTIEMLMTAPLRDWEVVIGKYIGSLVFITFLLLPALLQLPLVKMYGQPEWGPVISGYAGLFLLLLLLISMGLFFSSVSKSPIVAAMASFVAFLGIMLVGAFVPESPPPIEQATVFNNVIYYLCAFLRYGSFVEHYINFADGLINSRDVLYFLSGTGFFLFLSTLAVESRKWK